MMVMMASAISEKLFQTLDDLARKFDYLRYHSCVFFTVLETSSASLLLYVPPRSSQLAVKTVDYPAGHYLAILSYVVSVPSRPRIGGSCSALWRIPSNRYRSPFAASHDTTLQGQFQCSYILFNASLRSGLKHCAVWDMQPWCSQAAYEV